MNIYLVSPRDYCLNAVSIQDCNILESFYYVQKNKQNMPLINKMNSFLLDSGAFSFLNSNSATHWDVYLGQYADFINQYDVKLFFELDIDPIVGLQKVEQMRNKLEQLTGKKPIPVWHQNRGKQYFVDMCKEYDYVSLGGIVTKEIPRKIYEGLFPWFIATAHANNAKIHGLGFTKTKLLKKYNFDSVDSSTWMNAGRFGEIHRFTGTTIERITSIENGRKIRKLRNIKQSEIHNFKEWVKFSNYAKYHL